ncbi:ComF family protein [Fulvivirga aurantia]|uniref:ComF family protein n=1 Tax=Fulvivirga aurantia TaxID=2529383 RepID=UPI001FE2AE2C|nr:phosphoribosyltransferase family protein [Fulvivirga aurantia]
MAYYKFERKGRLQRVLHQLKYSNRPEVGNLIGEWYGRELEDLELPNLYDVIVPVPLHKTKLRRRGYNQSAQFAEGLSKSLNIPIDLSLLKRTKKTATQTKKTRVERWQNVEEIFKVSKKKKLTDLRVILVDDVITTGSTIESCAIALLGAGAASVGVIAIAAAK